LDKSGWRYREACSLCCKELNKDAAESNRLVTLGGVYLLKLFMRFYI